jgi:tetratricopeptide (TPR) repeat protein
MSIDGDDAGAEREYKRAMELDQNSFWAYHFYSNLLRMQGKPEEAVAQQRRALEIEPLSLIVNREYGSKLFFARRYDEAIAQFRKTIELDPAFPSAHYGLALVYWMKGNYAEAVEEHAKHQELNGEPQKAVLLRDSFAKGGWQEFLRTITDKNNHIDLSWDDLAAYYAALGEKSEAFEMLKKRFENRRIRPGALLDPRLDPLRDDPRFAELANAAVLK